jgi:beta-ureidopropionase / N-carbamoyl-L-amino-acid hydrolase
MDLTRLPAIDANRLWQRHLDLAAVGATPAGGVHRMALTEQDIAAHRLIADWALARGFTLELDAIGNMFVRRAGVDSSLPPVASGSHTDTQPYGGQFDGSLGVLCAFETLETLEDAGIRTQHPVEAIIWNNEEGARFVPGLSGSATYVGIYDLETMLSCTDGDGITMRRCVEALHAAIPEAGTRNLGTPLANFIEAHIEQGVILEEAGEPIGVVTGMQGNRRFSVTVTGENAHSGTTPRSRRKDAFVAATDMAVALREVFWDAEDIARFTIGMFDVSPGAKSVVPGRVTFFIDFRHPSADALKTLGDQVAVVCDRVKGPCAVSIEEVSSAQPVAFPSEIRNLLERTAAARGLANRSILSCAGHDARYLAEICPSGMVFIPCWKGISHNEAERAERTDVTAGGQVICDAVTVLAMGES